MDGGGFKGLQWIGKVNGFFAFGGDDFHFLRVAIAKIQAHVFVHKAFAYVFLTLVFIAVAIGLAVKFFAVIDFAGAEIGVDALPIVADAPSGGLVADQFKLAVLIAVLVGVAPFPRAATALG